MKYLIKFNESKKGNEQITQYLKDIFLELEDEGFNIKINTSSLYDLWGRIFTVKIYKTLNWIDTVYPNESHIFKMSDVLESILTAESYMKTFKYPYKISLIEAREIKFKGEILDYQIAKYDPSISNILERENLEMFTLEIQFSNK
jgi:hypothetical protein